MRDSALRLQDKTILLVGPFNGITQAILRSLTEFGADVGFVCENGPHHPAKYVEGINEAREVHPEYGRAVHYNLPLSSEKQIQEALGRVVESLGRMDALVDATPLAWKADTNPALAAQNCVGLAEKLIPFFLAKQRGRIVFLFEDPSLDQIVAGRVANGCRESLLAVVEKLAKNHRSQNVTVNGLSVGVTEDFLLKCFPKSTSIKRSMVELQTQHPGVRLVESHEIGMGTAYLTSALSASLTGQVLRLTHGAHIA